MIENGYIRLVKYDTGLDEKGNAITFESSVTDFIPANVNGVDSNIQYTADTNSTYSNSTYTILIRRIDGEFAYTRVKVYDRYKNYKGEHYISEVRHFDVIGETKINVR